MNPPNRPTRKACLIEILESRIAPALAVALTGSAPNFTATFTDDANGKTDNTLEIRLNAASELEFSLNGAAFTNDLDSTTPGVQSAAIANLANLAASLGTDSDTFIVSHTGGLVSPRVSLTFDGGPGSLAFLTPNLLVVNGTAGADTIALAQGNLVLGGQVHSFTNVDSVTVSGGAGADTLTLGELTLPGGTLIDVLSLQGKLRANAETIVTSKAVSAFEGIALVVDALDVQRQVFTGGSRLTIEPATPGRPLNLGSEIAGALSLTGAELNRLSGGIAQFGGSASGTLTVSAALTFSRPLVLVSGAGIVETGSLVVDSLRVESVNTAALTGANVVGKITANISGSAGDFIFNNAAVPASGLTRIGTVDGASGIHVSTATATNLISLTTTGLIAEDAGATITGRLLELKGGTFSLPEAGNNVVVLAANLPATHTLSYADADALTVGVAGGTAGIQAASVTLTTADGDLIVTNATGGDDVTVSENLAQAISLVAGSAAGQHRVLRIEAGAAIAALQAANAATLTANNIELAGTIRVRASVTLQPFSSAWLIDLGGPDTPEKLGLAAAEIGAIATARLDLGGSQTRALEITAPIAPAVSVLRLATGAGGFPGGIAMSGAGSIVVANLRLDASLGSVVLNGANDVDHLAANISGGGLTFRDVDGLNIAPVDGLAITSFSGPATFNCNGLTQTAPIVQAAGGGIVTINAGVGEVVLANGANDFTGPVAVNVKSSKPGTIADANDLVLGVQSFSGPLTVQARGVVTHLAHSIPDGFLFTGPGTLILTEANTSFAHITVSGGTLLVNSSSFTGAVISVKPGATLGGTGTLHGLVDLNTGGIIAPGAGPGVLHLDNARFVAASTFSIELNGTTPGAGHDQLAVTGTVNVTDATLAASLGYTPGSDDHLVIIANDGVDPVAGTFAGLAEGATVAIGGVNFTISYHGGDGNDVVLSHVVLVPPVILRGGKMAVFTDVDGDRVTITTTRGTFSPANFRIVASGLGGQLRLIDLHGDANKFRDADLTIAARRTAAGGNGRVDLGYLNATSVGLGAVTIPGDLGRIDVGDHSGLPALRLLRVDSLGLRGTATQDPGGDLASLARGRVGILSVTHDIHGATFLADENIGAVRIGGSFVSGQLSSGWAIGTIDIAGDIVGSALAPVIISAVGQSAEPARGLDMAIGSLHVGGGVGLLPVPAHGALRLLAGYDAAGVPRNADASIGQIVIGGYWRASTALAGVGPGPGGFVGVNDDAILTGDAVRNHPRIVSQISRIVIGRAFAGSAALGDSFGILAERIVSARINTNVLPFTPGAHTPADYFFPSGATGPGPTGLPRDFAIGEVKA